MKTFRNKVLSVLLFTFAFFVMHDYIIAGIDTDTQNELCYIQKGISPQTNLDLASQIHQQIHLLLNTTLAETPSVPLTLSGLQPLDLQKDMISYIHFVPQRPPLS